ncbi:glyoxylate/hydroxypyruvate reductase A [Pusillimonas sp. MFBS29]|uniref:2-hydroxyacid dehydrogenase n=1 Tax=Pusillimonas sp. MFBS29 TaxID=2886690 RepID=UPI001D10574C|nr:glyoxylate/hydroxypyruvate reductase A [Pusillimonas sp. MFBS29]MCC2596245.1 glyoxylate/hydroxypyruvate reductase A [Pusillimonas sp. MFBS29]
MTNVIFASTHDTTPHEWIEPLQRELPDVHISNWADNAPSVDARFAVVWKPPQELFQRETRLEAVFNLGAGVDALFKLPGLPADLPIYRLEDAGMSVQMAEYVVHALLRASRDFEQYQVQQRQGVWQPLPDIEREQWPVGIMGTGLMGTQMAQTLAALEYPVATWSRRGKPMPGVQAYASADELPAFLARTRVLVNTLPLTPSTQGMLCRNTFQQLLPDAYVINVARGEHLIEQDLLDMLASGHIKGATLDVFTQEPLPSGHPFWSHPAITITPHVAAASLRGASIRQVAAKIRSLLNGVMPTGLVNREQGY